MSTPMTQPDPQTTTTTTKPELNLRTIEDTVTQHLILQPADLTTLESLIPPQVSDTFWSNLTNLLLLRSFLGQTGPGSPVELYSLIPTVKLFGPQVAWLQTVIGGLIPAEGEPIPFSPLPKVAFIAYVRALVEAAKNMHYRRIFKDAVDELDGLVRSDIRLTDSVVLRTLDGARALMTPQDPGNALPSIRTHVNKLDAGRVIAQDTLVCANTIMSGGYRSGKAVMECFPSGEGKTSRAIHHGRAIILAGIERSASRPDLPDLRGLIVETEMPTQEMAHAIMCGTFGIAIEVIQMAAAVNILRTDPSNVSVDCQEAALRLSQIDRRFSSDPAVARATLEETLPTGLDESDVADVNLAIDLMERHLIIVPQPRSDRQCMQWVRQAVEDHGVEVIILDHINGIHPEDNRAEEWKFLDVFCAQLVEYCLGQRVALTYMAQPTDGQVALWRQGKYQSYVETTGSRRLGHHARVIIAGHRDATDKSRRVTLLTEIKSPNPNKLLRAPIRYVPEYFHYIDVEQAGDANV